MHVLYGNIGTSWLTPSSIIRKKTEKSPRPSQKRSPTQGSGLGKLICAANELSLGFWSIRAVSIRDTTALERALQLKGLKFTQQQAEGANQEPEDEAAREDDAWGFIVLRWRRKTVWWDDKLTAEFLKRFPIGKNWLRG
jgi:hypothetical protein